MSRTRAQVVHDNLVDFLRTWRRGDSVRHGAAVDLDAPVRSGSSLDGRHFLELLESQFQARALDLEARRLKDRGEGYYTIGSAGHEGNAAIAAALRPDDPAFLHYRSGAFFAQRAKQVRGQTPIFDVLLSLCASADDPIAGGRHKVFGSRPLWIPPQTSTIASHLPKAMGTALAIDRAAYLDLELPVPRDAVVLCSFGDATVNHSTALGALNAAGWAAHQHLPLPILFVCEDNGMGISVHTPEGWIEATWSGRDDIRYFRADGLDLVDAYETARRAAGWVRERRAPAFLHLELVRLLGHAGTDVELAYHDIERIKATEARDPLLRSCRTALEAGLATAEELLGTYEELLERAAAGGREAARRPHLDSAAAIMAPLAPYSPEEVDAETRRDLPGPGRQDGAAPGPAVNAESAASSRRTEHFGGEDRLPEVQGAEHLAKVLNWGLHDLMLKYPEMLVFGEDVARRGGVYGITARLYERFGGGRVFNTLLDEQSILGLAIGCGQLGFLPVPEIQYLAYYHNAQDQIRGEASSLQFFSQGQFENPMVVRIASFAYQKGFGGHFHNDNSVAALRDVPGIVVAAPARGDDAVAMLRTAMAMARVDGRVVLFLEPIALYMTRDLFDEGDGLWRTHYPPPGVAAPLGKARVYRFSDSGALCVTPLEGREGPAVPAGQEADVTIVSWANGLWRSLRAADRLMSDHGVRARVVDLRWLQPLDVDTLVAEARLSGRVLVVDEGRRTGGLSEGIYAALLDANALNDVPPPRLARVCGEDSFVTLGPSWRHILPDDRDVEVAALRLCEVPRPGAG